MRKALLFLIFIPFAACAQVNKNTTANNDGIIRVESHHTVVETIKKLVATVESKGLGVFTTVNHSGGAKKAEMDLRPTQVILFGNPKMGTALMQCNQNIGLDLPIKVLVFEDKNGRVWMTYNSPSFLAKRYQLGDCGIKVIEKMTGALKGITTKVAE